MDGLLAFRVVNLGCKVNRVESDAYEERLASSGLEPAQDGAADLVVVNTCTVTADAEKKTRKAVRRAIRENPGARVIVTGCSAAIDPGSYDEMGPGVRVVDKASALEALSGEAAALMEGHVHAQALPNGRARRGVKIQDGCGNACTFCIVHVARGASVSVDADEVVAACARLIAQGLPEVMLTGINLGAYRANGSDLAALLRRLLDELPLRTGSGRLKARLRLSSIEPQNVTADLARAISDADGAVCRHLHLPLQSGSSKVLKEMARHYDASSFLETCAMLKELMPTVSISTDIIAGFPGETEEDHQESAALSRAVGFSKMHVFPYSQRTGTPAAERADQIPRTVKEERARTLRALSDELRAADAASRAGTTELAAVESPGAATTESYHDVAVRPGIACGTLHPFTFPV